MLEADKAEAAVRGLVFTGNNFHSSHGVNRTVVLDETRGAFTGVYDTVFENNAVGVEFEVGKQVQVGLHRGTRATMSADVAAGSASVRLDFGDALVFGGAVGINPDEVRCALSGGFVTALSSVVAENVVTVHLAEKVPAAGSRVSCSVDQSRRVTPAH